MKTFTSWNGSKNLQDKIEKLKKKFFFDGQSYIFNDI